MLVASREMSSEHSDDELQKRLCASMETASLEETCTSSSSSSDSEPACQPPSTPPTVERRCLNTTCSSSFSAAATSDTDSTSSEALAAKHKGKTIIHGDFGGLYVFSETDLLKNGNAGYFGIIRFGCCLEVPKSAGKECHPGDRVVLKELLEGGRQAVTFHPRIPPPKSVVVKENSRVYQDGEEVTLEHLRWLRTPDGESVAVLVDQSSKLINLTLTQARSIFGIDLNALSMVPTDYANFLRRLGRVRQEVDVSLLAPRHAHLLPTLDVADQIVDSKLRTFIVLPYCSGGDMLDVVTTKSPSEDTARSFFIQIIGGLQALHDAGLAHRDLKVDNIFLDDEGCIRIADLGLAARLSDCHTCVGSLTIAAPEVLSRGSDPESPVPQLAPTTPLYDGAAADRWSLGVVLFNLLAHSDAFFYSPGPRSGPRARWARLAVAAPSDPGYALLLRRTALLPERVSSEAASLVLALLHPDPNARITLEQALKHPWVAAAATEVGG
mmetsp:Transcript_26869/g.61921  ORF Transcript_26869/g.61921 Transcript_26869/m.61921 type:complete len:497 (+) Transcript_26869:78-1568(+)|eukprot:CAMPEP_0114559696 /NCGR_PEP_ID=MMETSP0114-20121206/11059_1 /TAXON_ID=31324 /ORGANISM="Goniomonas sp, Strain m" /LENGTH=496 /DNA_ID=CAMNT_0001745183 /DNA_START=78 /DNA_END=1568 /DNA_ORIENTATION=+